MKSSIVNYGILIIALVAVTFLLGCLGQTQKPVTTEESANNTLTIVLKDIGFPEVKSLEPTILEVQMKKQGGDWITIWSDPNGKSAKLTPDGAEVSLDNVKLDAGTYTETRLKVSKIDVVADINRDGDTVDKNVQIILTQAEFDALPHGEKPSAPTKPSAPAPPTGLTPPDKPTKGSAPDNAQPGDKPSKPTQPTQPSQPSAPSNLSKPLPPGVEKIENGLVYMNIFMDEVHTATPPYFDGIHNDTYLYPALDAPLVYNGLGGKLIYDFALHPLLPKYEQVTLNVTIVNKLASTAPAVFLSGLRVNPTSITSGSSAVGVIYLSDAAPEGGIVVPLSGSYTANVFYPKSVTVKAGETNATFNITTYSIQYPINASIVATYNGATIYSTLFVSPKPIAVVGMFVSPASVMGGATTTGIIYLSEVVPVGSQVIQISAASDYYTTMPTNVTVNAGSKQVTFNISTKAVVIPVDVTIKALDPVTNTYRANMLSIMSNNSADLAKLILSSDSVTGGNNLTGTVVLRGLAPVYGISLTLSAVPGDYISMPRSLKVNGGESNVTFPISTKAVDSAVNVSIGVAVSDFGKNTVLTLLPNQSAIVNETTNATYGAGTLLLDTFNGKTLGKAFGNPSYVDSMPNMDKAVNLSKGKFIQYPFTAWYVWDGQYSWDRNEASAGVVTQGSVDMWIKPVAYSPILTLDWQNTSTVPQAGYILHFGFDDTGKLSYSVWGGHLDTALVGKTTVPLNEWSHIAVSFGPSGTKIYLNDKVDAETSVNMWPALHSKVYGYLNYWGEKDLGLIDNLRVSNVSMS